MAQSPLSKKLHVKPGNSVLLVNAPDGYADIVSPLPENATLATAIKGTHDCVLLFVHNVAEVNKLAAKTIKAVKPGGKLWIAYPKKTGAIKTDIHRGSGWDAITAAGWEGVSIVAIDDTWAALRFRPSAEVGT